MGIKAQTKTIGECTLQYSITQQQTADTIGTKWVYVKGDQCKTILQTPQMVQSIYFDTQKTNAIITKVIGASRFLQEVVYPPSGLPNLISMKEIATDSTFQILGYPCKNVELQWSDGVIYQIGYTPEISISVNNFELAFKEIGGLVLSYTIIPVNGNAIQYRATSIDFSPISMNQFAINKMEYQVID
jgi:hypothetical protein